MISLLAAAAQRLSPEELELLRAMTESIRSEITSAAGLVCFVVSIVVVTAVQRPIPRRSAHQLGGAGILPDRLTSDSPTKNRTRLL